MDGRKTRPLFQTPFDDEWASFSPDGRWVGYNTDESGRSEVYVVPFPALTPRVRVSTDGGLHPLWAPDERALYYRTSVSVEAMMERTLAAGTAVMEVPIETSEGFKAGTPRKLFDGPYFNSSHNYAITSDGKGFILIRERSAQSGSERNSHRAELARGTESLASGQVRRSRLSRTISRTQARNSTAQHLRPAG